LGFGFELGFASLFVQRTVKGPGPAKSFPEAAN
jgi:hypothetical protein